MSKITEVQAKDNLKQIKDPNVPNEAKVSLLNDIKSTLKRYTVVEAAIGPLFELVRVCMEPQQSALFTMGLSTLGHLLKRLHTQEPNYIIPQTGRFLPLIVDRLGDPKERHRELAKQCLVDFWSVCSPEVETAIRDNALTGKNARAKESAMQWISQVHQEFGLHFKAFVPKLVDALEDADGAVRERAKITIVGLFQNAEGRAKADLKKQLQQRNVRKTIVDYILAQLSTSEGGDFGPVAPTPQGADRPKPTHASTISGYPVVSHSVSTVASNFPDSATTFTMSEKESGIQIYTQKELEGTFRDMQPFFEGKESEQNWSPREKSILKLDKITMGNAPHEFTAAYLAGVKGLLDGILKTVNSLRTTVSTNGCRLVQDIAKAAGPGLDPMVEILLQSLIKLCGGTKKISAANGDATVNAILANVSYNIRLMQHIWSACQDKNIQPRKYATGWLKTMITKHGGHRNHLEHSGGADLMQKCIQRGLEDSDKDVRESMRGTYWMFASIWPERADAIMSALNATYQKLLENHPANPNPSLSTTAASSVAGGKAPAFSRSTTAPPKPSLKELLAQQRAAVAAKAKLPPSRPGSALAMFSPDKVPSTSVAGGLASKPVRPHRVARRPEIARPATADPYSVRRNHGRAETPAATPATGATRPKSKIPSPVTSPSRNKTAHRPGTSPVLPHHTVSKSHPNIYSPVKADEDLTIVMPIIKPSTQGRIALEGPIDLRPVVDPLQVFEDSSAIADKVRSPKTPPKGAALHELTLNEPGNPNAPSPARLQSYQDTKVLGTPEGDVALQDRYHRLLRSGIVKIETGNLDIQGFRKIQKLIKEQPSFPAGDPTFSALLTSLLQALDKPIDVSHPKADSRMMEIRYGNSRGKIPPTLEEKKALDVRSQALNTVRVMLSDHQSSFMPFLSSSLCSLISSRRNYDDSSHIASGYDKTTEELVSLVEPEAAIQSILAQIDHEDVLASRHSTTTKLSADILSGLLRNSSQNKTMLPQQQLRALGSFMVKALKSDDPDVRRSVVELSVELHKHSKETFWELLEGAPEQARNIVAWALAKRGQISG